MQQTDHMAQDGAKHFGAVGLALGLFAPPPSAATAIGTGLGGLLRHTTTERLSAQAG